MQSRICHAPSQKLSPSPTSADAMFHSRHLRTATLSLIGVSLVSCQGEPSGGRSDSPVVQQVGFVRLSNLRVGVDGTHNPDSPNINSDRASKTQYAETAEAVAQGEQ